MKNSSSTNMQIDCNGKALLIDGHNLLFASYFGMPDRIKSTDGKPIHGTYGFIAAVLNMIRRFDPDAIVVCFDAEQQNFRNQLSSTYKSNRPQFGESQNPFSQLADIKRGLSWLGVRWLEIDGVEADDIIGTLARKFSRDYRVYIASMDHDMYQLIDERIYVFSRARGMEMEYGPDEILAKYKVRPTQIVDYRALVGDPSDGIMWVTGIGSKTASLLLSSFDDIEGIFANLECIKPRIALALAKDRDSIELNRRLITIKTDVQNFLLDSDFTFPCHNEATVQNVRSVMRALDLMA